ncbi:uncharacterized protein A4U43_C05F24430 [Asparagus officinalis]|uniref:Pentacotripeptide-repeat region of PRORP domain-containing protein n=2 Tax=Asparagus officinalis TaxID=4686 RepID=A0A5P1EWP4_ASPOF|nr:uncharacterized protein A4U43_C05F24430 [Asparagus officinalis]
MDEMERKDVGVDDVSYYTLFCGMKKAGDFDGVCEVYRKMKERDYVPRVRTVMLLMKYFCEKRRSDLGLEMWDYLVDKGCCPHRHALDLLVIGLCCSGKVAEAFECFKQVVERGRLPSERSFMVLEGALGKLKELEKVEEMKKMMESLGGIGESQSMDHDEEEESFSDCK